MGVFDTGKCLLLDGDIIIYKLCVKYNEDHPVHRRHLATYVKQRVEYLCQIARCDSYKFFITGKLNYRNFITDDYKANRRNKERPVNLAWAKQWSVDNIGAISVAGLEADDLIGIHSGENTVIWSIDKDIKQIPGEHLDEISHKNLVVGDKGELKHLGGSKYFFTGYLGFCFQLLVGDGADYIIGCGSRITKTYKSGAKVGQDYTARVGVQPAQAYKALSGNKDPMKAVKDMYKMTFGGSWANMLETQAALLHMGREVCGNFLKLWTVDGRDEYINVLSGEKTSAPNKEGRDKET